MENKSLSGIELAVSGTRLQCGNLGGDGGTKGGAYAAQWGLTVKLQARSS